MDREPENVQGNSKQNTKGQKSVTKEIFSWIKVTVAALLIAVAVTTFVKPSVVIGSSMYPTLQNGNYLLVNRMDITPHYGDIIVFNTNLDGGRVLIKRVIATPGDLLKIQSGQVRINGKLLHEPYVHGQQTLGDMEFVIPSNKYFVMGDNRGNSLDSRFAQVGLVDRNQIIGEVAVRVYPPTPISN